MATTINLLLPWPPKILSPNARPHWGALSRAKRSYRGRCYLEALAQRAPRLKAQPDRMLVQLRFLPRTNRRRDQDNLVAAMKSGLDGIANAMGIDDRCFVILPPQVEPAAKGRPAAVVVEISLDSAARAAAAPTPPSG